MKTYQQFISEAKQPKPDALDTIGRNLERRTPGMKFHATNSNQGDIRLQTLKVPKENQNKGIGTRAMEGLGRYADNINKRITLSPQADPRKKGKLNNFYRGFGFKPNKGRNKDFSVSDTMIRNPNR